MSAPRLLCSVVFSLAIAFAVAGCSSDTQDPNTGALSLELTIAGDIEIDEVAWVITGGDMPSMDGTIDTSAPGSTASIEVFGLPATVGQDYTITMEATATDEETKCKGSEDFGIDMGEVTEIMVMLNCKRPQRLGAVRVNGKFNICAELVKATASPLQTSVGNDIDLTSQAEDADEDPITYSWTATGGSLDDSSAASTTYTCLDAGDNEITISVTDNDEYCNMATWTFDVACVPDELECTVDDDCGMDEVCVANTCVSDPDVFCNEGLCLTSEAARAACIDTFLTCVAAEPANDEECLALGLAACNVECVEAEDCDEGEICVDNECVRDLECDGNDDCEVGEVCFNDKCWGDPNLFCDEGICADDEEARLECNATFFACLREEPINEDECIALALLECNECNNDGDCPEGEVCIGNECVLGGEILEDFQTSLHKTRAGKEFWYKASNNGMELLTGVDYNKFACKNCHDAAANPDWTEPTCADCHDLGDKHLQSETCLGCHGRQKAEIGRITEKDFHTVKDVGGPELVCADCHKSNDVHGNGTEYDSMLRPGAIAARCDDCHREGGSAPVPSPSGYHSQSHVPLDCALCHTQTVTSCINCHVEEDLDFDEKCQTGPVLNWKFVMKWDKEGDGKEVYHPATLMTLKYNCDRDADPGNCPDAETDPKKSFAVFAPFYAHTVTQQAIDNIKETPGDPEAPFPGSLDGCAYCHSADNCDTIMNAGQGENPKQKLIEWTGTGLTNPISGLIPLPADYADRFEVDYAEFEAGPGTHCPTPDMPKPLVFYETGPDMWQTGEDTTAPNTAEMGHPLNASEFGKFCPEP